MTARRIARRLLLAGLAAAALAGAVSAHGFKAGSLSISHPWSLALAPGAPAAAGYLTIANAGPEPDRLVAANSPRAERVEIHRVVLEDGVARMRPQPDGLPLPAGETLALEPGGLHLMLFGPQGSWAAGDSIPLELDFERAGKVTVELAVHSPADAPKASAAHH